MFQDRENDGWRNISVSNVQIYRLPVVLFVLAKREFSDNNFCRYTYITAGLLPHFFTTPLFVYHIFIYFLLIFPFPLKQVTEISLKDFYDYGRRESMYILLIDASRPLVD